MIGKSLLSFSGEFFYEITSKSMDQSCIHNYDLCAYTAVIELKSKGAVGSSGQDSMVIMGAEYVVVGGMNDWANCIGHYRLDTGIVVLFDFANMKVFTFKNTRGVDS